MAMPDEEIIKALECCMNEDGSLTCRDCPFCNCSMDCFSIKSKNALDLIKRKDAEIDILKAEIERLLPFGCQVEVSKKIEAEIKTEAIKEFAERLKTNIDNGELYTTSGDYEMTIEHIDNLVKEMVGD